MQVTYSNSSSASNRLLAGLSHAERQRLQPFLCEVELPRHYLLYDAGDLLRGVWFPHDALISTVAEMPEGQTVEVGLTGNEGMAGLGLLHHTQRGAMRTVTQIPGYASRMTAGDFRREVVAPRGELYERLLHYAEAYTSTVAQIAACNATHRVEQRLARWLLMAYDRVGRERLSLTHEFLAATIGVRRASITQFAGELRRGGAIEYAHGQIVILDRSLLERHSCGCYEIVRELSTGLTAA